MHATLNALQRRGWTVTVQEPLPLFTAAQRARYPEAPSAFLGFLGAVAVCRSPKHQNWIYGPREYSQAIPEAFRWNECELMSLDASAGDARSTEAVRQFWDRHIPFMMSVHSDYDYLALRVGSEPAVVHGCGPEFEEATPIASSFEELLRALRDAALEESPPWPLCLFLTDYDTQ